MKKSPPKKYRIYIIKSLKDGTYYTGISTDVSSRLKKHNSGKGAKYTKTRTPFVLYIMSINEYSKSDAMKEEYRIKQLPRNKKLELIHDISNWTVSIDHY